MRWLGTLIALAGLALLVVLFFLLKPDSSGTLSGAVTPEPVDQVPAPLSNPEPPSVSRHQPELVPLVRIEGGQRVAGPAQLRVQQGEPVQLRLLSDSRQELHLHGYDLTLPLNPGEEAVLEFTATLSGRFEYELHGHHAGGHAALGVIEVYPR